MHASGKARLKVTIVVLLTFALLGMILSMLTGAQPTPQVSTGKTKYEPNELVEIRGESLLPTTLYRVLVAWPDNSARLVGNNGAVLCTDPTVADGTTCYQEVWTGADGLFILRYQLLGGLTGAYGVHVYNTAGTVVASTGFTGEAAAPNTSPSNTVRAANELGGQVQPVDATAFESQRKVFRNPRGVRHTYALVTVSNRETAQPGGLVGGLWLFRSTDGGATWAPHTHLKLDIGDPPTVSGSMWPHTTQAGWSSTSPTRRATAAPSGTGGS